MRCLTRLLCVSALLVSVAFAESLSETRKKAEQGDADAQNNLGKMYASGESGSKDYAEALRWYRKAAEQGHARAQNNIGTLYLNGNGVPKDSAEAVRRYREAAEQGDAFAQFNLGGMYLNGNLREDPPEFWARLSGVPSADRRRTLPTLEISARGRVEIAADTIAQSVHFDVATRLATTPTPSDASFQLDVALAQKALPVTSVLRSKFFDVGELMALADAFSPSRPPPSAAPAPAVTETVVLAPPDPALPLNHGPLGVPFWGGLRGTIALALVLSVPAAFAVRQTLEVVTFGVVLLSLVGQGLTVPWLTRRLGLAGEEAARPALRDTLMFMGLIDVQETIIGRKARNTGHKALRARAIVDLAD